MTGGIIGTDPNGKIEVINTAANKILGLEDNLGLSQKLEDIAPEFSSLFGKAAFLKEGSLEEEIQIVRSNINEKIFLKISPKRRALVVQNFGILDRAADLRVEI